MKKFLSLTLVLIFLLSMIFVLPTNINAAAKKHKHRYTTVVYYLDSSVGNTAKYHAIGRKCSCGKVAYKCKAKHAWKLVKSNKSNKKYYKCAYCGRSK